MTLNIIFMVFQPYKFCRSQRNKYENVLPKCNNFIVFRFALFPPVLSGPVFWHAPTSTFVYARSARTLNFHDPKSRKDAIELVIGESNAVRGGQRGAVQPEQTRPPVYHVSGCGNWIAAASFSSEGKARVKVWKFGFNNEFTLSADLYGCHEHKVFKVICEEVKDEVTLITAAEEGVKIWQRTDEKWVLNHFLEYKFKCMAVALSDDASLTAIAYENGIVGFWSVLKGQLKMTLTTTQPCLELVFHGHHLICASPREIKTWNCFTFRSDSISMKGAVSAIKAVEKALWVLPAGFVLTGPNMKRENLPEKYAHLEEVKDFAYDAKSKTLVTFGRNSFDVHSSFGLNDEPTRIRAKSSDFQNAPGLSGSSHHLDHRKIRVLQIPPEDVELTKPLSRGLADLLRLSL